MISKHHAETNPVASEALGIHDTQVIRKKGRRIKNPPDFSRSKPERIRLVFFDPISPKPFPIHYKISPFSRSLSHFPHIPSPHSDWAGERGRESLQLRTQRYSHLFSLLFTCSTHVFSDQMVPIAFWTVLAFLLTTTTSSYFFFFILFSFPDLSRRQGLIFFSSFLLW